MQPKTEQYTVISSLKDKELEKRIVGKARSASKKVGMPFDAFVATEYEIIEQAIKNREKRIKISSAEIEVSMFLTSLGLPRTLGVMNGTIYYCHGIPKTLYEEPTEPKMAHELLHQDYDKRNLMRTTMRVLQNATKRGGKKARIWVHESIETFINMNIDGFVAKIYGSDYEKEIERYCEQWLHETINAIDVIKMNNLARILSLSKACIYYARVPSQDGKIHEIIEKLVRSATEMKNVLFHAALYRRAFEEGKKGRKLESMDIEEFYRKIMTR